MKSEKYIKCSNPECKKSYHDSPQTEFCPHCGEKRIKTKNYKYIFLFISVFALCGLLFFLIFKPYYSVKREPVAEITPFPGPDLEQLSEPAYHLIQIIHEKAMIISINIRDIAIYKEMLKDAIKHSPELVIDFNSKINNLENNVDNGLVRYTDMIRSLNENNMEIIENVFKKFESHLSEINASESEFRIYKITKRHALSFKLSGKLDLTICREDLTL